MHARRFPSQESGPEDRWTSIIYRLQGRGYKKKSIRGYVRVVNLESKQSRQKSSIGVLVKLEGPDPQKKFSIDGSMIACMFLECFPLRYIAHTSNYSRFRNHSLLYAANHIRIIHIPLLVSSSRARICTCAQIAIYSQLKRLVSNPSLVRLGVRT